MPGDLPIVLVEMRAATFYAAYRRSVFTSSFRATTVMCAVGDLKLRILPMRTTNAKELA